MSTSAGLQNPRGEWTWTEVPGYIRYEEGHVTSREIRCFSLSIRWSVGMVQDRNKDLVLTEFSKN